MSSAQDSAHIREYLKGLQEDLVDSFESLDEHGLFGTDAWEYPKGGGGLSRAVADGTVIEKGGVNFSHVMGDSLPASASASRPQLAGRPFEAMGVSVVIHPKNPYAPTSHMNVRYFTTRDDEEPVWWFGGGFDLTPYYPNDADIVHWHRTAKAACDEFGADLYPQYKATCDEYFYLKHRDETRGVGGLFFDDLNEPDFDTSFAIQQAIGSAYREAYLPILLERKDTPYGERERQFQCYRRGRYVEFNLVFDRGTLFGLQSGGRTESILMSLPPVVHWHYQWKAEAGSPEEQLATQYLRPRDWLGELGQDYPSP